MVSDNERRGAAFLGAYLGRNQPPPFDRGSRVLADAEEAKVKYETAYKMITGEIPPPDDELLAAAGKIVGMAQEIAATGVQTFGQALAALRYLLIDGSPHVSQHDAMRRFGIDPEK